MSKIKQTFEKLAQRGEKAFIPYVMAGDPSLKRTEELVLMLEQSGADIVELGVPFSDPLADGPVIQRAAERALKAGVTLGKVLGLVSRLRDRTQIPIVLMTYYNPVFKYGEAALARDAAAAGCDGLIVPDLPPEEAEGLMANCRARGVDTIFLLAPTSTENRIRKVAKASTGFVYYVSLTGITGSKLLIDSRGGRMKKRLGLVRRMTKKPVAVGFGISTPVEAKAVSALSDGVIVGSAIVKKAASGGASVAKAEAGLRGFLRSLREAIA